MTGKWFGFVVFAAGDRKSTPLAEAMLTELSNNLQKSKYKVYGRLTKENKRLVDEIVSD